MHHLLRRLLLVATLLSFSLCATPPRLVIFDVHGVLLKENIDTYVKELVYEQLLSQNKPVHRSFKKSAPFKKYCELLEHYQPLSRTALPKMPAGDRHHYEVYHLFAGNVAPNALYRKVKRLVDRGVADGLFADEPAHLPLMVATLIEVMFDPEHIHRDKYMLPLYEGLRVLQTITAQGINTAIVSNVPQDWMLQYLQSPKLKQQFAFINPRNIFTSGALHALKPHPELFNKICTHFALTPEEILLIDDTPANVFGARACKVNAVLFNHQEIGRVLHDLRQADAITHKNEASLKREFHTLHTSFTFGERTLF